MRIIEAGHIYDLSYVPSNKIPLEDQHAVMQTIRFVNNEGPNFYSGV